LNQTEGREERLNEHKQTSKRNKGGKKKTNTTKRKRGVKFPLYGLREWKAGGGG